MSFQRHENPEGQETGKKTRTAQRMKHPRAKACAQEKSFTNKALPLFSLILASPLKLSAGQDIPNTNCSCRPINFRLSAGRKVPLKACESKTKTHKE
jgi:hypothetical protein